MIKNIILFVIEKFLFFMIYFCDYFQVWERCYIIKVLQYVKRKRVCINCKFTCKNEDEEFIFQKFIDGLCVE